MLLEAVLRLPSSWCTSFAFERRLAHEAVLVKIAGLPCWCCLILTKYFKFKFVIEGLKVWSLKNSVDLNLFVEILDFFDEVGLLSLSGCGCDFPVLVDEAAVMWVEILGVALVHVVYWRDVRLQSVAVSGHAAHTSILQVELWVFLALVIDSGEADFMFISSVGNNSLSVSPNEKQRQNTCPGYLLALLQTYSLLCISMRLATMNVRLQSTVRLFKPFLEVLVNNFLSVSYKLRR